MTAISNANDSDKCLDSWVVFSNVLLMLPMTARPVQCFTFGLQDDNPGAWIESHTFRRTCSFN
jgi:hypothetical protein